jgi:hypothetical protein
VWLESEPTLQAKMICHQPMVLVQQNLESVCYFVISQGHLIDSGCFSEQGTWMKEHLQCLVERAKLEWWTRVLARQLERSLVGLENR